MSRLSSLKVSLCAILLLNSACSVRFPAPEEFRGNSLPINVSAAFEQNRVAYEAGLDANETLGPLVVRQLAAWRVFRSLESKGLSQNDYSLLLSVSGDFDREIGANKFKRMLVGFSLFLLSPFLDMTARYSHSIDAQLLYKGNLVGQYSIPTIETELSKAHGPFSSRMNEGDYEQAKSAHVSRLAAALADAISRDRANILSASGQRYSHLEKRASVATERTLR